MLLFMMKKLLRLLFSPALPNRAFAMILCMTLIAGTVIMSLLPMDPAKPAAVTVFSQEDKVVHFFAFAVLTTVLLIGLAPGMRVVRDPRTLQPYARLQSRGVTNASLISAFLAITMLGVTIELFQKWYTTSRTFDPWDMLANAAGSGSVCLLFRSRPFVAWRAGLLPAPDA